MRLIGQSVLTRAGWKNAPLRKWLAAWSKTVQSVTWNSLSDVRRHYPTADGVKLESATVVTVFNVKGNEYRLVTAVDYNLQTVAALDLLTHAEYDKALWKLRY